MSQIIIICGLLAMVQAIQVYEPLGEEWFTTVNKTKSHNIHPRLKITESTVSGFSTGATWTANIMSIDPETFSAGGIFAGQLPQQRWGKDAPLEDKKIFIYQGAGDPYFTKETFDNTVHFFNRSLANVTTMWIHDFHHVMPNSLPVHSKFNKEKSCATIDDVVFGYSNASMARNCGYNLVYYFLNDWFSIRFKKVLKEAEPDYLSKGQLLAFNQTPFSEPEAFMDEIGYLYLPDACLKGEYCTLHVHLHGCWLGAGVYKDVYLRQTGFLEYAAANNIIMLFPQAIGTFEAGGMTHHYCWNSCMTDDKYDPQISSIHKMMESLILYDTDLVGMVQKMDLNHQEWEIDGYLDLSKSVLEL